MVSLKHSTALAESGIRPNLRTVDDSHDNALAETINGLYKTKLIHAQGSWTSIGGVELTTLESVHWWNNKEFTNPRTTTPQEVETTYYLTKTINTVS